MFAYLRRFTLGEDLCLGVPLLNRPAEFERTAGLLMEILPVRIAAGSDDTFDGLLRKVRKEFAATSPHRGHSVSARTAGYDVLLNYRTTTPSSFADLPATYEPTTPLNILDELDGDTAPSGRWVGREALSVNIEHAGNDGEFVVSFDFNRGVWPDDAERVRAVEHFLQLLQAFVDDRGADIDAVELLTTAERGELLGRQASSTTLYPRSSSLVELFESEVSARPDNEALRWRDGSWSYAELNAHANRFAHRLRSLGVGPDVLVGLCGDRSPWLVAGMLGIVKAGGAYVPLDPAYPAERLRFMLADTRAPVVLADTTLLQDVDLGAAERLDLNAQGQQSKDTNPDRVSSPDHLAYVMYTSGSTGTPKGVEVLHRNVVRLVRDTNYVTLDERERVLQLAPTSFDAATFEIWGPLLNGAVCVLYPERTLSLEVLEHVLTEQQITCLFLTTALFNNVLDLCPSALSGVQQLFFGGEAASAPHAVRALEQLPTTRLHNIYGPTEGTTFDLGQLLARQLALVEPAARCEETFGSQQASDLVGVKKRFGHRICPDCALARGDREDLDLIVGGEIDAVT